MHMVICLVLIAVGIFCIILKRNDLWNICGIFGIVLTFSMLTVLILPVLPVDIIDFVDKYFVDRYFPNKYYVYVNEETSQEIYYGLGNYVEKNIIHILLLYVLPIIIIILGLLIDLSKVLFEFIIYFSHIIYDKIYKKRYISYITVHTKFSGDVKFEKDHKKNIITSINIIDIEGKNFKFHVTKIKCDAEKEIDLLTKILDNIFDNGCELYNNCMNEFYLMSHTDFSFEGWCDWIKISHLNIEICFDDMILTSYHLPNKNIQLGIDWKAKKFIKI